jgi:hypothetical protein
VAYQALGRLLGAASQEGEDAEVVELADRRRKR